MINKSYPSIDELLGSIGEAGSCLNHIAACEGAAGNISLFVDWPLEFRTHFPLSEAIELPQFVPELAGKSIIVTGSGRRLRDIQGDPLANLGIVVIAADGQSASLHTSPRRLFSRITSEFNSHLAVHADQVGRTGTNFQALIHAQPHHLVYLSHIPAYRDQNFMNKQLLRWEPETIVQLPEGIGVLPFILPGSPALMEASVIHLRTHQLVLWSKHGILVRSNVSITHAADLVEYVETAAHYEYMDLVNGSKAEGLTREELDAIAKAYNLPSTLV